MTKEPDPRLIELIGSIDASRITNVTHLKKERQDLLVSCESGRKHLIRFEKKHISLIHQKWAYEKMRSGGIPCPEIEAFVETEKDIPEGCMILSWIDAIPAAVIIGREGRNERSMKVCYKAGEVLKSLHSVQIDGPIPDYVFISDRQVAHRWSRRAAKSLLEHDLIDQAFAERFLALADECAQSIPDPVPHNLCFWDMHFFNIIVYDTEEPEIAGIIDVEETGVGWPMWDFTNWERWGLYYGDAWVRDPVLEAYGEIDMAMYRFAVMTRMAQHPEIFTGTIREQVTRAVDAQDIMAFDLDKLYPQ